MQSPLPECKSSQLSIGCIIFQHQDMQVSFHTTLRTQYILSNTTLHRVKAHSRCRLQSPVFNLQSARSKSLYLPTSAIAFAECPRREPESRIFEKKKKRVAPRPSSLPAQVRPPWRRIIRRTLARPTPVPSKSEARWRR